MPGVPGMPPEQPKKGFPKIIFVILGIVVALLIVAGVGLAFCSKSESNPAVGTWRMEAVTIENGTITYDDCVSSGIDVIESFEFNADGTYSLDWPGMLTLTNEKWTETDIFEDSHPFAAELPAIVDEFMDGTSAFFIVSDEDENTAFLTINTTDGDMLMFTMAKEGASAKSGSDSSSSNSSGSNSISQGKSGSAPSAEHANALEDAHGHLNDISFSRSGLIEQLEDEGYPTDVATWAVDNCGADWNEQAVIKATEYLSWSDMSRSELIDQLEFEGFTASQAQHGVDVAYK